MNKNNNLLALLSYISILVLIPYIISNNKYVRFHTIEGLNLFIIELVVFIIYKLICNIFIASFIIKFIYFIICILCVILSITGIINVLNNNIKGLPIISKYKLIK